MYLRSCTNTSRKFILYVLVTRTMAITNSEMSTVSPQHRDKHGVSYGWVSQTARKRSSQSSCFQTLTKCFKLYCKHSSLVGLKYLVEDRATWFDRTVWIVAYMCTIFVVFLFSLVIYQEFIDTPITATPEAEPYPTRDVEFPGVAICSINRISLRKATELATEIYNANISNLTLDQTLGALWTLGGFYESPYAKADNYTQVTRLLSSFYNDDYNITDLMKRLTPECSAMLVLCNFQNEKQNCSDIFTLSRTEFGFCCTFNYIPDDVLEPEKKVRRVGNAGRENGLTLVLDPTTDDYFYPILSTTGWKVMIFDPNDYPDVSTGGVVELLLAPLAEKDVVLNAVALRSSEDIRSYPIEKRGCYFPDERPSISTTYTASDCILACKIQDIWNNCKCRPFFYLRPRPTERSNKICTTEDLPCLTKYRNKRFYIVPYPDETLSSLINNSRTLYCQNCYPSCEDNTYIASSYVLELEPGDFDKFLPYDVNFTNYSLLRMYFGKSETTCLKQDKSYRWYEYLSDAGGTCGFFIGFSLISVMEIVYLSVLFFLESLQHKPDLEAFKEDEEISHNQLPIPTVYWNELLPRSRIGIREPNN